MKIEKLDLKGIKNVLSRAELKKIMAGSAGCNPCQTGNACCNCTEGMGGTDVYLVSCGSDDASGCDVVCDDYQGGFEGVVVNCDLC